VPSSVMPTSRRGGGLQSPAAVSTLGLRKSYGDMDSAGIEADELTVHTPDLDDVFFALTGGTDQRKEALR
jgi:ABC-2 type transport system ATP-binding protein